MSTEADESIEEQSANDQGIYVREKMPNEADQSSRTSVIDSLKTMIITVAATLITIFILRNTLTWYLQWFWGASADFWQHLFDRSYKLFGGSYFPVAVFGTTVIFSGTFIGINALLSILDLWQRPAFLMRYKIQPGKNIPMDMKKYRRAVSLVAFNLFVVAPCFSVVMFFIMSKRGCKFQGDLPTFQRALLEIFVFILVEEVSFYYSHRLLHSAMLYRRIHKIHHEWTAPIGIVSIYAHPIEHLVSNMIPPALGPLLMGSHIALAWLWFSFAILTTINAHCGYHFPFFPSPEAHDYHHFKYINNFGVLGVLDRFHGTDTYFRQTKAYNRHLMMLSFIPPREAYPDSTINSKQPSAAAVEVKG